MTVPFLDLKIQNASIADELRSAIDPVIEGCQFILGPHVKRFEESFAKFCGTKHCVGLNNGTSALHMALTAHDVKRGDEVITTPHSWISTSWAIDYVGARPVFVDIDPETCNLDPELIEAAITPNTKAILPVHLYGQAADLTAIKAICDKHNLVLIEDAAQAHGAKINGQPVGSMGDSGCFSFYPGKNLGGFGEGGAVTTNSAEVAERILRLRDHSQQGRHNHVEIGFNTRMEGLQGAVLDVKLRHLPAWTNGRREHSAFYRRELAGIDGLQLPVCHKEEHHVWHLFVVLVDDRDSFRDALTEEGVSTGVHYPTSISLQPAFSHLGHAVGDFPIAENVMSRCVSLPMFAELTHEQREKTVSAIKKVLGA